MSLPLPLHSYERPTAASSRLVNCFIEKAPADSKNGVILFGTPGIKSWITVGAGPIRAMLPAFGVLYVVSGTGFYSVTEDGTVTYLGSVGTGNVSMAQNATAVCVVTEPDGFVSVGGEFAQITDFDFTSRGASSIRFLSNYLLAVEPNTGRFFGSNVGSVTDYDSLDYATAESSPDNLVGIEVDHGDAILFGEKSIEVWAPVNTSGFVFARRSNGTIELGCKSGQSIAKYDNSVVCLASDNTIRKLSGTVAERISQHGIEAKIKSWTPVNAFSYTYEGHVFYVLNFAEGTIAIDATTGLWHERASYGYRRWRPSCTADAFGKALFGDSQSNKIGEMDAATNTEWGEPLVMSWTYQNVYAGGAPVFHDRLSIRANVGRGTTTGQGSAPKIMLECSDNGGRTFESLEDQSLGAIGEYGSTVTWTQLGNAEDRVYRASISDPVERVIADTQLVRRVGR